MKNQIMQNAAGGLLYLSILLAVTALGLAALVLASCFWRPKPRKSCAACFHSGPRPTRTGGFKLYCLNPIAAACDPLCCGSTAWTSGGRKCPFFKPRVEKVRGSKNAY